MPPSSLLPLLDFCIIWTNSLSCRHAWHKMKKHQEPKHWLLQGRSESIKLIVLLVLTLAWSFHVWVARKSINYTFFVHLACSNQGFQTLNCPAQQWSWPPIFWGNHNTLGNISPFSLIPSWYAQISPVSRFLMSGMVLKGLGCGVTPPTSHDHGIPACALPPFGKPASCRAHYRLTVLFL